MAVSACGGGGEQFEVVLWNLPEDYSGLYGTGCVTHFELSNGDYLAVGEGYKDRFTVLEDVQVETAVLDFGSPAEKFDEFWPKAQQVLGTVEWKGM